MTPALSRARALLQLMRIPNVFTSFADVAAGLWIAGAVFELRWLGLLAASGCLYLAGMVLNDFFDREEDARERPERPIPSGRISAPFAAGLGGALGGAGVALASHGGGGTTLVAGLLLLCVLAYDGGFGKGPKVSLAGPFLMGGCRMLNVALGVVAGAGGLAAAFDAIPQQPAMLLAPLFLFVYTTLVTWLAREEAAPAEGEDAAETQGRERAARARAVASAMGLLLTTVAAAVLSPAYPSLWGLVPLALLAAWQFSLLRPLWEHAPGPMLGRAIGGSILFMPVLDAVSVAGVGRPLEALAVCAFIAPAWLLKRWFYMT